jgi:DNA polymerase IV
MDCFFAQIETRDNPALAPLPVAVGGHCAGQRRSVISACNYLARTFGVHSAMPVKTALQKCPALQVVPGRMAVYKSVSAQFMVILRRYSPCVEPLSLDEAYVDVSDCLLFEGSATRIAQDMRRAIHAELSLTASAGISSIKFIAKIASDLNKPNGQSVITPTMIPAFIAALPLEKIPGVGKVTLKRLHDIGLVLGRDVTNKSLTYLQARFGKFGETLWARCHGNDPRQVEANRIRKSVGIERTFEYDIKEADALWTILSTELLPELARRAAPHFPERQIKTLAVKVKFNDFHQTTKQISFSTWDHQVFARLLPQALKRGKGKSVRLIGAVIRFAPPLNEKTAMSTPTSPQLSFSWDQDSP